MNDLFDRPPERGGAAAFEPGFATEASGIELFEATLIGRRRTSIARGHSLFEGFDALKVITFSSSVPAILSIVELFQDAEITFGSERILARELAALEQASTLDAGYRFVDAVADQKAFIERFVRPALSKGGRRLLQRVLDGTLRFRMLRGLPSHEKLYLMSGSGRCRALLGSANLSIPALRGRQKETFIGFDHPEDYEEFLDYYSRDVSLADPIDAELLVVPPRDGADPEAAADPVEPTDVPALRVLKAGAAIVEEPRRAARPGFSAAALREAERHGAELRSLALDRNRAGAVVVTAEGFRRAYRAHQSKPIQDGTEQVPRAVIDLEAGLVTLDGRPWHRLGSPVPWPEVQRDAELLKPYFDGFASFYGDAAGLQQSYWALMCWLYSAPFAPLLRSATVRHDGSPLNYPVHAVLYGRSDGGKTMFSRVMSRSMFRVDKMIRAHEFTAKKAFGLRDMLGAIPLIVDDVNRDRFTSHVPDLVKFDHEVGERYAPILISTNRDVTAVAPELGKRMVVCAIHGARPRSLSEVPARRALSGIGTALYRAFLDRLAPVVPDLVARVADDPLRPPDLIRSSSEILADLLTEALGETPAWAIQVGLDDLDRLKDKPFLDQLRELDAQNPERVAISRTAAELTVNFAGDHLQASRFEKLVPAQALKGRLADTVKLDLAALEKEYGFALGKSRRSWLARLLGR